MAKADAVQRGPVDLPEGGPGCRAGCCWKWFTAMLVQELQVLKKSNTDARQALELHLCDAAMRNPALAVDPEAADALGQLHKRVHQEWTRLKDEGPRLRKQNEDMQEEIARRRQEVKDEEAEVAHLEQDMHNKQSQQATLEEKQSDLDEESARLAVSKATLTGQLQETEQLIDKLRADSEALRTELINLEMSKQFYANKVKPRSSKKKSGRKK